MEKHGGSVTESLSRYVVQAKYNEIPKEVINKAKLLILDSIGNAIAGSALEPGKIVIEVFGAMAGSPDASLMATGQKMPLLSAIYINSYLSNLLDFDDTYANMAHPGATVIPAAIAIAEKINASGEQLLTSVVIGYETSLRIGLAIIASPERYKKVWGLSTWQVFGSISVAVKLLDLDAEQARNAFGLGGVNAPVPYSRKLGLELEERPIAWSKNNYGWSAMGGVLGVMLAKKGFLGNRYILDGEKGFWVMAGSDQCDFQVMTRNLGSEYMILDTSIKPYASCRWTHSAIDACLTILERHKIMPNTISSVTVKGMYEIVHSLSEQHPKNIIDAQFSLPFLISLCIAGHSPANGLSEVYLCDNEVQSLAERVRLEVDSEANRLYFENAGVMASTVIIETTSDEKFEQTVLYPKGSPEVPLTSDEVNTKFMMLSVPIIGKRFSQKIQERVMSLESIENMSSIFDY